MLRGLDFSHLVGGTVTLLLSVTTFAIITYDAVSGRPIDSTTQSMLTVVLALAGGGFASAIFAQGAKHGAAGGGSTSSSNGRGTIGETVVP